MSQFWEVCHACGGAGGDRHGLCRTCAGMGRLRPKAWGPPLAAAVHRAEAELGGAGPGCSACGGSGELGKSGLTSLVCVHCAGLGRTLSPRRAPDGAEFLTTAEVADALGVGVDEVHVLVSARRLTPILRAPIGGPSRRCEAFVFSLEDLHSSRPPAAAARKGG